MALGGLMIAFALLPLAPAAAPGAGLAPALGPKALWFAASTGLALIGGGYFLNEGAPRYALVLASMVIGGAAQLWLTEPLWFPAPGLRPSSPTEALMLALIALQGAVAIAVLHARQKETALPGRMLAGLGPLRLLVLFALSAALSISFMGWIPGARWASYAVHLAGAGALIGLNMLSVAALLALPAPFTDYRGFHPLIPAGVALIAGAALARLGFSAAVHVEDELAYLFQARTFAAGSFTAPAPPEALREGLQYYLLDIRDGQWFAVTAPGWPALLAIGVKLGVPWLINPLAAGLSVLLGYGIARRLGGKRQADLVALLTCCSPWFLGAAGSLMPHSVMLMLVLAAWWLLLIPAPSARRAGALALLAGFAMGWAFTTRQLDGLLIGTGTGLWLLWRWARGESRGFLRGALYGLGAILAGSYYLIHNAALTGSPLTPPLARYLETLWSRHANAYGFGPEIGPPEGWGALDIFPGHGPLEGLINTLNALSNLQLELFGWGIGSLALIWALLLWGRFGGPERLMGALVLAFVAALFFYWFSGAFYIGPRYWFSALFGFVYLSASGHVALNERLARAGASPTGAGITLFMLALYGLLIFTPWRAVTKYHHFGNSALSLAEAHRRGAFGNAIVLVSGKADPGSALMLNDPFLPPDKPIFLIDTGQSEAALKAALPGREIMRFRNDPPPAR